MSPSSKYLHRTYSSGELISDAIVHSLAIIAGMAGFALLFFHVAENRTTADLVAVGVYCAGFFAMFGFSLAYNMWPGTPVKWWLRRLDHAAIYLMIAGSCTVFLSQLDDPLWAISLIAVIWSIALLGMAAKLMLPGRFERAALFAYLALGWICVIAAEPLVRSLPVSTLVLMVLGGAIYSAGVFFYRWESLRYHNTIWHGFVVVAAICHFTAVTLALTSVV